MRKTFLNLIAISLITFFVKSILDIVLRWFLVLAEFRENLYGIYSLLDHIKLDFIFFFWVYIVITFMLYYILFYLKKVNFLIIYIGSTLVTILILLYLHEFQFPMKQYHLPPRQAFNYMLVEEITVYTLSLFPMIYMIKKTLNQNQ